MTGVGGEMIAQIATKRKKTLTVGRVIRRICFRGCVLPATGVIGRGSARLTAHARDHRRRNIVTMVPPRSALPDTLNKKPRIHQQLQHTKRSQKTPMR